MCNMEDLIDLRSPNKENNLQVNNYKCPTELLPNISPTRHNSFNILHDSFSKTFNLSDFGRESLPFFNRPSICGRESLQLLPEFYRDMDCGRESLGILQINNQLLSDTYNIDLNSPNLLNTGFLHPSSCLERKFSTLSSVSSINSLGFERNEISSIYSVDLKSFEMSNQLNNAFFATNDASVSPFKTTHLSLREPYQVLDDEKLRLRLQSLPSNINQNDNFDYLKDLEEFCTMERKVSDGNIKGSKSSIEESDDDNEFNDSVFIEANHLASKIADGSFLDDSLEDGSLDHTSPPDWETSDIGSVPLICDTETVFKTVDKMLPPAISVTQHKSLDDIGKKEEQDVSESNSSEKNHSNGSNNLSKRECFENLSEIFSGHSNKALNASNNSKSKDTQELLQNLSNILNNEHRDEEQKLVGQNLLFNLAEALYSDDVNKESKMENSTDNVLDLRTKSATSDLALDLSFKNKSPQGGKRLTHSFSFPSPKLGAPKLSNNLKRQTATMKKIVLSVDGNSYNSNDSKNSVHSISSSFSMKLKPKKSEENSVTSKKGPLKAIIPITTIAKKKEIEQKSKQIKTTPIKQQALKRTSTPIATSKLKPVAQSTPDDKQRVGPLATSSQLKKKYSCPVSPLARPSNENTINSLGELNKSDSLPNLNNSKESLMGLNRRRSASDLKAKCTAIPLKRSYSIGKENNTAYRKTEKNESSYKIVETRRSLRDSNGNYGIKPCSLINKLRKSSTGNKIDKPINAIHH